MLEKAVSKMKEIFSKEGIIRIITHLDTDGLTSAIILSEALRKHNQIFLITTIKQLEEEFLQELQEQAKRQKWKALVFLDLGSGQLSKLKVFASFTKVFVIDHHELEQNFDSSVNYENDCENFYLISSFSFHERLSASCLTYLFVKNIFDDKRLAQIAVLGLIGDVLDKNIGKLTSRILQDAQESGMQIRKGLTVFSSMRPVHKALEFSNIFIPGVTGYANGALEMLRELGIEVKTSQGYRTLLDLNKEELSRLITGILLRRVNKGHDQEILDNIYLIKIGSRLFDAREISSMINACGRLGYSSLAIAFLAGSKKAREKIEDVYTKYKSHIIKALNLINGMKKIQGEDFVIINAKNAIKDTIIGTVVSILSSSFLYNPGAVVVGMSHRTDNKIKVSARIVKGSDNRINLYHLLRSIVNITGGEVGGHINAAGCLISKEKEQEFLELLEKKLRTQEIKIGC
ncbi:MAG: DHH family phosphoesterase [Candidatus Pacearchaeota archaeon]|nr:DHH family phosphoesterase [Candidatus Pacearchaeota archaeon]